MIQESILFPLLRCHNRTNVPAVSEDHFIPVFQPLKMKNFPDFFQRARQTIPQFSFFEPSSGLNMVDAYQSPLIYFAGSTGTSQIFYDCAPSFFVSDFLVLQFFFKQSTLFLFVNRTVVSRFGQNFCDCQNQGQLHLFYFHTISLVRFSFFRTAPPINQTLFILCKKSKNCRRGRLRSACRALFLSIFLRSNDKSFLAFLLLG